MQQVEYQIKISKKAEEDIINIYKSLSEFNFGNPKTTINETLNEIDRIKQNPNIYSVCLIKELSDLGYRYSIIKKYIIFYLLDENNIYIARIKHLRSNYINELMEDIITGDN